VTPGGIVLGTTSTDISLSADGRAQLQKTFRERHFVQLPGLLSAPLLDAIASELDQATFRRAVYENVGSDLRMAANGALEALHLATNDRRFLDFVEAMTDCRPLSVFAGRIYRMIPGANHEADWHDDLFGDRRIGMSINLGRRPYRGGLFQLRRAGQSDPAGEVHNTGPGDAIVFRLGRDLEHRVTPLGGEEAKTAFAGWFRPGPSFQESIAGDLRA
jgi:hypothetical protein